MKRERATLGDKIILLANEGYKLLPNTDIYCDVKTRKCFSLNFLIEAPFSKIKAAIAKPTRPNHVELYFAKGLPDDIKEQLREEITQSVFGIRSLGRCAKKSVIDAEEYTFCLDADAVKKYEDWAKSHKCKPRGAIGGNLSFCFTPTSLGMVIKVKCSQCNAEVDLSDYENW